MRAVNQAPTDVRRLLVPIFPTRDDRILPFFAHSPSLALYIQASAYEASAGAAHFPSRPVRNPAADHEKVLTQL